MSKYVARTAGETSFEIVGPPGALEGSTPDQRISDLWGRIEAGDVLQLHTKAGATRVGRLNAALIVSVEEITTE